MRVVRKTYLLIIVIALVACTAYDLEDIDPMSHENAVSYAAFPVYDEANTEQTSEHNNADSYCAYCQADEFYQCDTLLPEESLPDSPLPIIFGPDELTLENLLILANQRRQIVYKPNMERIYNWLEEREPITLDGAVLFNDKRNNSLSADEAAYDIKVLFTLLRHIYAAYHHFGGDEVFLPIMDEMLEEIRERERWSDTRLFELIQSRLGAVIVDSHFVINAYSGSTFGNPQHSFIWDTPFDRSDRGFKERETGLYISNIEGYDMYELFRLTMNEAGEFYYAPVIFRPAAEGITHSLNITYENGEQITLNLTRTIHERTHARGADSSLSFQNGIPIVSIRRMGDSFNPYSHGHQEALRILSYAEQLREEPVIIVDIRSNGGGASALSYTWLHRLTGEVVPANFNWLSFFDSHIDIPAGVQRPARWYSGFRERAGFDFEYPPELFGKYLHRVPIGEDIFFTPEEAWDRIISNDQLIIVLIDRFSVSAGETFADQFTNIENTLIIGQNTFGMLLTSSNVPLYLPNSGMPVIMGRHLLVHPEGTWEEGIGIAPDVWVVGDALQAALSLLIVNKH